MVHPAAHWWRAEKIRSHLVAKYPAIKRIAGHRDYAAKACPCFDATAEYRGLVGPFAVVAKRPEREENTAMVAALANNHKPIAKSKTAWAATAAVSAPVLSAVGGLSDTVAIAAMVIAVGAAAFIIWDRWQKAETAQRARDVLALETSP